jgi:hypothetical protein
MRYMRMRGALTILCAGLVAILAAGSGTDARRPPGPARVSAAFAPAAAADLAVRLQALLGQHSVLAADLMRSRIRGDDDFVQAANAALGDNTDAMTGLISRLFGAGTAKRFEPMWADHIVSLVEYAGAVAGQDAAALAHARSAVERYEEDLAAFFAGASHGRLSPAAARGAILLHVRHLTTQVDAYAKGDYATADRWYRMGFQHTYDLGRTLADALLPAADRATLRAPLWRLRSQLGKLLAEHAVLVEDVTRAAVTNTPDFEAAADMINGNTRDLAAAVDTLFGAPAAKRVQALWASHVEHLVGYAAATAGGDAAGAQRARAALPGFERDLAAVLSPATGGRMTAAELATALGRHDEMLLRHADAYAAKDYQGAHEVADRTYQHMFDLARQLADGFGAEVAARLPRGGPETGLGGLAGVVGRR